MDQNVKKSTAPKTRKKSNVIKDTIDVVKSKVKSTTKKTESKTTNLKKLKLLVTIVDRNKTMFYEDLLEQYEINMQIVFYGHGTAAKDMLEILGLANQEKSVILSIIREDKVKEVMQVLQEKFEKVKNGKGIAFTVPLQSLIGVYTYQFFSNNTSNIKEEK